MHGVFATVTAMLFQLEALGVILFVLGSYIITPFAFGTSQGNSNPHSSHLLYKSGQGVADTTV
jgi:hypothetical protein